ncbi:MAG TPA: TfpX/TfpZ family type IV pilin accessory protein [Burkholderiaceae bacterium]|nr:TfpX/TfpZ family type IV pilin accessory protein [Burkholderiaceae bacterium]
MKSFPFRIRFFLTHLAISAVVIGLCVAFIVFVWYRPPFAQLEGIFSILLLMAAVDVGAGPLCTLVAASPKKTRAHLARDLAIIASVQLLALGYAVYTTCIARPVYVVYSVGQFEVEHANELKPEELAKAQPPFSSVPWFGPVFVEARFPDDPVEATRIVNSAILTGTDIKDMPRYFQSWPYAKTDAREKAKALTQLPEHKALREKVVRLLEKKGVASTDAAVLPINGKIDQGTVVLRASDLAVLGIVPYLAP